MQIVRAQPSDASTLSALAWAAKANWDYPADWMEQWRPALTITPDDIAANQTFVAVAERQIIGFYALHEAGGEYQLEHLWVLPGHMGQGIGRALFRHAAQRAADAGATRMTIEADPNAEQFYLRMGAQRTGVIMSRVDGQQRALPLLVYKLEGKSRA